MPPKPSSSSNPSSAVISTRSNAGPEVDSTPRPARAVLGSKEFVNEVFELHREKFGAKRKDGARPIRALASIGLNALRALG